MHFLQITSNCQIHIKWVIKCNFLKFSFIRYFHTKVMCRDNNINMWSIEYKNIDLVFYHEFTPFIFRFFLNRFPCLLLIFFFSFVRSELQVIIIIIFIMKKISRSATISNAIDIFLFVHLDGNHQYLDKHHLVHIC